MATVVILAAATAVLVGCSSPEQDTNTPVPVAQTSVVSEPVVNINHRFGETAKVYDERDGNATYTLSAPRVAGQYTVVDLDMACVTGTSYGVGTFQAVTQSGKRVDFTIPYQSQVDQGAFDPSVGLVAAERRTGYVLFDTQDPITQVILYHGTINPPVAIWK